MPTWHSEYIVFPKIEWYSSTSESWQDDLFFSFSFFLLHDEKDIETSSKDARCDQNYDQLCVSHTRAFLLGTVMAHRKDPPWRISVRISSSSLSFSHFATYILNIYIKPRKSQQVDFAKSEKEHFGEGIATPCLFRVQSSRTGHEYKVRHTTTHTVFQIGSWVKSLSCLLSRHICEEMCFIIPRNLQPCLEESALMKYYF